MPDSPAPAVIGRPLRVGYPATIRRTSSGQIAEIIRVISEIATATIEQSSNAQQVAEAIGGIAEITEQAAAGSTRESEWPIDSRHDGN